MLQLEIVPNKAICAIFSLHNRVLERFALQRALIGTIEQTIRAVEEAEEEISRPPQLELPHFDPPQRQWRVDVEREAIGDRLATMGAATAEVVQLTAIPDDDSRVGAAIATIGSNMPEMSRGVRVSEPLEGGVMWAANCAIAGARRLVSRGAAPRRSR